MNVDSSKLVQRKISNERINGFFFGCSLFVLLAVVFAFDRDVTKPMTLAKALTLKSFGFALGVVWISWKFLSGFRNLPRLIKTAFVFLLTAGLSTAFSLRPGTSLDGVYERQFGYWGLVCCVLVAWVFSETVSTERRYWIAVCCIVAISTLCGTYAVLQWMGADPFGFSLKPKARAFSFFGNANSFGTFGATTLPLSFALMSQSLEGVRRSRMNLLSWAAALAAGMCTLLIATGVFISGTRYAWLALGGAPLLTGISFIIGANKKESSINPRSIVLGLVVVYGLLFIITLGAWIYCNDSGQASTVCGRFESVPSKIADNFNNDPDTRVRLWIESIGVLANRDLTRNRLVSDQEFSGVQSFSAARPEFVDLVVTWLFGVGLENFRYSFLSAMSREYALINGDSIPDHPHNTFLYYLCCLGLAGGIAYLFLNAFWLYNCWCSVRRSTDRQVTEPRLALYVSATVFTLCSIANSHWTANQLLAFALIGLSSAAAVNQPRPVRLTRQTVRAWWVLSGLFVVLGSVSVYRCLNAYRADQVYTRRPDRAVGTTVYLNERAAQLRRAVNLNPRESLYQLALADITAARAAASERITTANKLYSEAQTSYRMAVHHAWAPEIVFLHLAEFEQRFRKESPRIISALENVLRHNPYVLQARLALIENYKRVGREDLVRKHCVFLRQMRFGNHDLGYLCPRDTS